MRLDEVWTLFERISHYYPVFTADDDKAAAWQRVLSDMPLDVAIENLEAHAKESDFQPTPSSIRREYTVERSLVPDVDETRRYLEEMDKLRERAVPMPDHVRKELSKLARRA